MTNFEKLEKITLEIDVLIDKKVDSSSMDFQTWRSKAERTLIHIYGDKSFEVQQLKKLHFTLAFAFSGTKDYEWIEACKRDLLICKNVFQSYLEELKEERDETHTVKKVAQSQNLSKIFIVHGHDEALKQSVARLIEKQDIEAIILSEKANKGKTIIEKLEENSDVGCAICLFTPDDTGKANKETDYKARARQNVVLEAGFFMGKLGREHVVYLASSELELPSDLQGIVYVDKDSWQFNLLKELRAMGYTIDMNKL